MRQAGVLYPFGRPLCAADIPNLDDALARTQVRVDANRVRLGERVDPKLVREVVRNNTVGIAPWPFAAIVA